MKNRSSILTVENCLYLASVGLALALRLWRLGASPLAESEAREALIAFQWVRGLPQLGLPQSPAYFFASALGFLLFGANDAIARLAPSLAGASLALLPVLFRDKLGRTQALLTSGLLAISAGMLAASRTADGTLLALAALGWGVGILRRYLATRSVPLLMTSAVLFGLALAGGAPFVTGVCISALATLAVAWRNLDAQKQLRETWLAVRAQGGVFFVTLGVTALLVATVGLAYLPGLGALAGSWRDWLVGFAPAPAARAAGLFPAFLLTYEPLVVVFGLAGIVLAFRPPQGDAPFETDTGLARWLAWFAAFALVFCLIYGGCTLTMVVWLAAPLTVLAACALVDLLRRMWLPDEWAQIAVQVALISALFVFVGLRLANFVLERGSPVPSPIDMNVSLAVLAVLMAVGITLLFGAGWSWKSAVFGAMVSIALTLLVVGANAGWGLTQAQPSSPAELWWESPTAEAMDRLIQTVNHVSNLQVGSDYDVPVTVQSDAAGGPGWALRWAFRNFTHASFVTGLGAQVNTAVVVAPATPQSPVLGSAYVGQAFAFKETWAPGGMLDASDWVAWLLYRTAPVQTDKLILWVRQGAAPSAGQ